MVAAFSLEKPLDASLSEPRVRTIARSGRPVPTAACVKLVAMASTQMNTATTPATPMTMTNEAPSRRGMLSRLSHVTARI